MSEATVARAHALRLSPNHPVMLRNVGLALQNLNRFDDAIGYYQESLRIDPTAADTLACLAGALHETRCPDQALAHAHHALTLDPACLNAHRIRAEILLHAGDYEHGWLEYEWRLRARQHTERDLFITPRWQGEALARKTLLVFSDEGFGDCLQFMRFLPLIAPRGGGIVFLVPRELARLLNDNVKCNALTTTLALAAVDYAVPLLSLPLMLGVTAADIPTDGPYIHPDLSLVAQWQDVLASYSGLRVGLCWAGSPENNNNHRRSCALAAFAPLATVPGVEFFSLQKGPAATEAHTPPLGMVLHDFTSELRNFADTAAFIASLDLVISVDTVVCHLVGAMGVPTWVLLSFVPSWRWKLESQTTPWYPTMCLFRQPRHRDWDAMMTRVIEELRARIEGPFSADK